MTRRMLATAVPARFAKGAALLALAWLLGAQAPAVPQTTPQAVKPAPVGQTVPAAPPTNAKLPGAIDPRYAHLKPGAARRKTCSAQYRANKADGGNAGLKWHAFYKACNTKLKSLL